MIRKVYSDFLRGKARSRDYGWFYRRGKQYLLTQASVLLGRPFCGPVLGTLVTNYRCNYRCAMCDLRRRDGELRQRGLRELSTEELRQVIDGFAALGTPGIGFTGGEPLLREDLFDLLAYTKQRGMITHLNTNGALLDGSAARRLVDARVDSLNISLDGACAETHDGIRGQRGAFQKAVAAVEAVRTARDRAGAALRIKTVAVLQEANVGEVRDLVRLAADLQVDCVEFIPRQTFAAGSGAAGPAGPGFLKQVGEAARYLLSRNGSRPVVENSRSHLRLFPRSFTGAPSPVRCTAGYNSLAVDCYGEVYPCVPWYNWRRSAGNLQGTDLVHLWYSKGYRAVRNETAVCRRCYLNCQTELNLLFAPVSGP